MRFLGAAAAVTGAGSGIGRATACRLAEEGATIGVIDLPGLRGGTETIAMIESRGGAAILLEADVTDSEQLSAAIDRLVAQTGRLDAMFNNAGVNGPQRLTHEHAEADFDRVIAINLKAVWTGMKAAIAHMRDRGGAIVNTASTASFIAYAGMPAYTAAKHAVLGLTKCVALEYADVPIRVNCVCPAPIETPMMRDTERRVNAADPAAAHEQFAAMQPLHRYGTPEEVAALVSFLLSDEAGYCTGSSYLIDGGLIAKP